MNKQELLDLLNSKFTDSKVSDNRWMLSQYDVNRFVQCTDFYNTFNLTALVMDSSKSFNETKEFLEDSELEINVILISEQISTCKSDNGDTNFVDAVYNDYLIWANHQYKSEIRVGGCYEEYEVIKKL